MDESLTTWNKKVEYWTQKWLKTYKKLDKELKDEVL